MKYRIVKLLFLTCLCAALSGCHSNTVKDIDGNRYKTVTIGTQVWMKENLKTTRYNDGTLIPLVTDYDAWTGLITPAFCWYNNDQANKNVYGALYNWYAVSTGKLCPVGWHVSDDSEWIEMKIALDGAGFSENAGGILKEAGTSHWKSPNTGANNKTGFTALPGGYRSYNGSYSYLGIYGYWWSSNQFMESNVYFWNLRYKSGLAFKYIAEKPNGFSVRCLKDSPPLKH
jgi:uncharacterized protein (TIGR02145 family)